MSDIRDKTLDEEYIKKTLEGKEISKVEKSKNGLIFYLDNDEKVKLFADYDQNVNIMEPSLLSNSD